MLVDMATESLEVQEAELGCAEHVAPWHIPTPHHHPDVWVMGRDMVHGQQAGFAGSCRGTGCP